MRENDQRRLDLAVGARSTRRRGNEGSHRRYPASGTVHLHLQERRVTRNELGGRKSVHPHAREIKPPPTCGQCLGPGPPTPREDSRKLKVHFSMRPVHSRNARGSAANMELTVFARSTRVHAGKECCDPNAIKALIRSTRHTRGGDGYDVVDHRMNGPPGIRGKLDHKVGSTTAMPVHPRSRKKADSRWVQVDEVRVHREVPRRSTTADDFLGVWRGPPR